MTTEYALLDPQTGTYTRYASREQVLAAAGQQAVNLYLKHTHDNPYTLITVNADGSESWSTPTGQHVISPAELAAVISGNLGNLEG